MKLMDFVQKLGPEIPPRFPVYNHNPYDNCTYLGTTSRGTSVSINSEVMSCDLKIAIGAIVPHPQSGFGGGGKIILPGVAHIDTIVANHKKLCELTESGGMECNTWGLIENNVMRLDIEETARMAGLDAMVNAVVNLHRDTIGLFVGDLVDAHREGTKLSRKVYATETPEPADVVVANCYSKANEGILATNTANKLLKEEGGDLIIICNIPEGQICHYADRSFGKARGGGLWGPIKKLPDRAKRMIALGPYIDKAGLDWIGPPELITIASSWSEILDMLKKSYGDKARVTVIPDATLQYFPDLWK
jgi:nickel-dependent lactate racemase